MTLGELGPGAVFRGPDGGLYRRGDRLLGAAPEWLCERLGAAGRVPLPATTPVEPLDLPALPAARMGELEGALRGLLPFAGLPADATTGDWEKWRAALAAARAALEGAGGKQAT
jgi:hypothetical protein